MLSLFRERLAQNESADVMRDHRFGGSAEEQAGQRDGMLKVIDEFAEQSHGYAKVSFRAHQGNVSQVATNVALLSLNVLRSHTHLLSSHSHANCSASRSRCLGEVGGLWLIVLDTPSLFPIAPRGRFSRSS